MKYYAFRVGKIVEGIEYKFTARPYQYSSSADMNG